jgi:hypothetical protein
LILNSYYLIFIFPLLLLLISLHSPFSIFQSSVFSPQSSFFIL